MNTVTHFKSFLLPAYSVFFTKRNCTKENDLFSKLGAVVAK